MSDMSPAKTLITLGLLTLSTLAPFTLAAEEVNIYSARKEGLIKPLLDRFTEATGIKTNLVTGKGDALLTRLKTEGRLSPADLLITTDVGRLYRAKQADVLQAVKSTALESAIPEAYRESDGYWFGLSRRSRVIVYAPGRVKADELSNYAALADEKWKGRVCIRSSGNIYNQSLVASVLEHDGLETTEKWLTGLVANFARSPQGGDRDQIKAVAAGVCDVAVVNSYYLGAMLNADEASREVAGSVELFWPNQGGRGAHINISGAAVTKSAKNKANAIKLIEFLSSEESQQWYGEVNHEYPVRTGIKVSPTLKAWGDFKADDLHVEILGERNAQALMAMDRAQWK